MLKTSVGQKEKSVLKTFFILVSVLYLLLPFVAGVFEVGNRWGPKIYPKSIHEIIYEIAWSLSTHNSEKPRIGHWYKEENRPWFYGMKDQNFVEPQN